MTNEQYVRNLPIHELAKLLVREVAEEDYDDDYDGNSVYIGLTYYYVTSDNAWYLGFGDAIEHEIEWLKSERKENN